MKDESGITKTAVLSEKLYQAYRRGLGATKIPPFGGLDSTEREAWLHAAEIAVANVCDPRHCSHIDEAVKSATEGLKANHEAKLARLETEHAAALDAAKVEIVATEDGGTEVRRGDEVLFAAPAVAEAAPEDAESNEANLCNVLEDLDNGIAAALKEKQFEALQRLIAMKGAYLGLS